MRLLTVARKYHLCVEFCKAMRLKMDVARMWRGSQKLQTS